MLTEEYLQSLPESVAISKLCLQLGAMSTSECEDAIRRLVAYGKPAIAPLIQALSTRSTREGFEQEAASRALIEIGELAVEPLIEAMQSKKTEVRTAATSVLASIGNAQAIEALRDQLYQEVTAQRRECKRWAIRRAIGLSLLALIVIGYIVALSHHAKIHYTPALAIVQVLIFGGFVDATVKLRHSAVTALSKVNDVKMIGALVACLSDKDKEIRAVASETLKKLLPQVRASDKQYIPPTEMDTLLKKLDTGDHHLIVAILKAFEQVGDEKALPKVEQFAVQSESEQIRRAAMECLPYLRQRAEQHEQAQTLLRASAPFEVAPDTLLRPAQGVAPIESDQLLRAHNAPE